MGNKTYRNPMPAHKQCEHEYYEQWLTENGYLREHLNNACEQIAELTIENKRLKLQLESLPIGKQNKICRNDSMP